MRQHPRRHRRARVRAHRPRRGAAATTSTLTARVAAERIPLTVCPISNVVLTGTVPSVAAHPFASQRAAGVLVTINSDDPGMSCTTIADDYEQVAAAFSLRLRHDGPARPRRHRGQLGARRREAGTPAAVRRRDRRPAGTAAHRERRPDRSRHRHRPVARRRRRRTRTIARAVDDACREVGFMQIVGHGIPDAAIAGLGRRDRLVLRPADGGQAARGARRGRRSTVATRRRARNGSATASASCRPTTCSRRSTSAPPPPTSRRSTSTAEIYAENIWPDADGGSSSAPGRGVVAGGRRSSLAA